MLPRCVRSTWKEIQAHLTLQWSLSLVRNKNDGVKKALLPRWASGFVFFLQRWNKLRWYSLNYGSFPSPKCIRINFWFAQYQWSKNCWSYVINCSSRVVVGNWKGRLVMGIFSSCLETKPCLQEHVSLTEKTCPRHGVKKRPIRLLIGGGGAAEVDNTLLDQSFSSYHTKAEFNNCFYYSFKIFPSS